MIDILSMVHFQPGQPIDLTPARWLWFPGERTLQNTVVLFRREFSLDQVPVQAVGWLAADSRYRLYINGQRVQSGPAPCDPRDQEADPVDLAGFLVSGPNTIGIEVLYFGVGDGTWPLGLPGLLFSLEILSLNGQRLHVTSDATWRCHIDRAWMPGRYKRWYLRALQEIVDTRLHPQGWMQSGFDDGEWLTPLELPGRANQPSLAAGVIEYMTDIQASSRSRGGCSTVPLTLRARSIPLLDESKIVEGACVESGIMHWQRDPEDWFEFRIKDSFRAERKPMLAQTPDGAWVVPTTAPKEGQYLTFALEVEEVGFPYLEFDAPSGAIIEIITQESHDPVNGPEWLDSHYYRWGRVIARGGAQTFEAFDYENTRWIQIHVRSPHGDVLLRRVGQRRRRFPWPQSPVLQSAEPALNRLFAASINTLHNCADDHISDGAGRERQQYSGDVGHQLISIRHLFGVCSLPERFIRTFAQGQMSAGYFLDCWPGYNFLTRFIQRELGLSNWGPIIDHGVGFVFDCHQHWMETGNLEVLRDVWPRFKRQMTFLTSLLREDGLLAVEDMGIPCIWIDHDGFSQQRHKRCAFNLYVVAMLRHAMLPLAHAFDDPEATQQAEAFADKVYAATVETFWDANLGLFVDNFPWLAEEGGPRTHDRTLATAVVYGLVPDNNTAAIRQELTEFPTRCGRSFPPNAVHRFAALAELGRTDAIAKELREIWASDPSVLENGTLGEWWNPQPDSTMEWSHCPMGAVNAAIQHFCGLRPTSPGYKTWLIRPQLADLDDLSVDAHTVGGCFRFRSHQSVESQSLNIEVPDAVGPGEIHLPAGRRLVAEPGAKLELSWSTR
ncbi:MAG TPA: alpha-L-rhamnosidase N-terminal domain-containing protein [Chthoniobacterales bacterium]|jgi:hypothetical protein